MNPDLLNKISRCSPFFNQQTCSILPVHVPAVPLQEPFDRHSLLFDPSSIYPKLQVSVLTLLYETPFPATEPWVGEFKFLHDTTVQSKNTVRYKLLFGFEWLKTMLYEITAFLRKKASKKQFSNAVCATQ